MKEFDEQNLSSGRPGMFSWRLAPFNWLEPAEGSGWAGWRRPVRAVYTRGRAAPPVDTAQPSSGQSRRNKESPGSSGPALSDKQEKK